MTLEVWGSQLSAQWTAKETQHKYVVGPGLTQSTESAHVTNEEILELCINHRIALIDEYKW